MRRKKILKRGIPQNDEKWSNSQKEEAHKSKAQGFSKQKSFFPLPLSYHKEQDISIHVFSNLFSGFFKVTPKTLLVTINLGTDAFRGVSPHSTRGYLVLFLHTAPKRQLEALFWVTAKAPGSIPRLQQSPCSAPLLRISHPSLFSDHNANSLRADASANSLFPILIWVPKVSDLIRWSHNWRKGQDLRFLPIQPQVPTRIQHSFPLCLV